MTNGVAAFCRSLATELAKRGDEVLVIVPSHLGKSSLEKGEVDNLTIYRLKSVDFPFYPDQSGEVQTKRLIYKDGMPFSPLAYNGLRHALNEFQPDVIHSHMPGPVGWSALVYAKRHHVPFVTTGHSYPDNFTANLNVPRMVKKQINAIVRTYLASIMRYSDFAIFPAQTALDDLFSLRAKRKVRTIVVRNGVDLSQFSPKKAPASFYKKYNIPQDKPIIAFIGRLDKEKSIDVLMQAFKRLRENDKDLHLLLVGDGNFRKNLIRISAKLKLGDHVIFAGRIGGEDLTNMYRAATLYATASTTEVQSIAILEAMACGKPIIAVDAGPMSEICRHNLNGLLSTRGDTEEFAANIARVLSDDKLRDRLSKGSIVVAKEYSIGTSAGEYRDIYQTAALK